MMKTLVIGATGNIGTAVADALAQADHHVVGVAHAAEDHTRLAARRIEAIVGDLAAPAQLAEAVATLAPDAVVWTATTNRAEIDAPAITTVLERLAGTGTAALQRAVMNARPPRRTKYEHTNLRPRCERTSRIGSDPDR